jgi:PAS domain S-box-containing protein
MPVDMRDERAASEPRLWADVDGAEALDRYRTLVDLVDDGIYRLDAEGRFVAVDDAVVEATGYAREELLGEHASILLDAADVECVEGAIRVDSTPGEATTFRFTLPAADEAGENA